MHLVQTPPRQNNEQFLPRAHKTPNNRSSFLTHIHPAPNFQPIVDGQPESQFLQYEHSKSQMVLYLQ